MNLSPHQISAAILVAGAAVFAAGTRFSDYTPLTASAGPVPLAGEATPITFGNPDFEQRTLTNRATQITENEPNSGSWDMNTTHETGPQKGRFLFTVFETGNSGVQTPVGVTEKLWPLAFSVVGEIVKAAGEGLEIVYGEAVTWPILVAPS